MSHPRLDDRQRYEIGHWRRHLRQERRERSGGRRPADAADRRADGWRHGGGVSGDRKMWFEPKSNGYGSGLPISWEGWLLLAGFFAGVFGLGWVARHYFTGGE